MKKVDQTIFDTSFGNCFAACIASIFELELDQVPFPDGNSENFWRIYDKWFTERGFSVVNLKRGDFIPNGFCLGVVSSPRHPGTDHAVVIHNGKVVHDPHPSRASEMDNLDLVHSIDMIYPLDPSRLTYGL